MLPSLNQNREVTSRLGRVISREQIHLRSKVAIRFYEPIILLLGLNVAYIHNQPSKAPDLSLDTAQSPELEFHCFVNKLGQLCDSERGGNTVTAFVVLKCPDRIQYRFASNQRSIEDLDRARTFIINVLRALGDADKDELRDVSPHILRKVLAFNKLRVVLYLKNLEKQVAPCISACKKDDTDECELEKLITVWKTNCSA